jgi:UDP-glucose 4-epimerase
MRKALITGGAGFIGGHLVDRLLADGWEVTAVDRIGVDGRVDDPNFHFVKCDITDAEELTEISKGADHVFHLAANSDIRSGERDPDLDLRSTFMTTRSVLDAMAANGISKLFFPSTSAVYGDKHGKILNEETGDMRPISYYGAYKLASEAIIHSYSFMMSIDALIFRFPNVIGPRLTHGVIFDFVNKLKADATKLEILGDGMQRKQYIHVSDLINGISMLSYDMPRGVGLYNISAESSTTVNEIADIVCARMGLPDVEYRYTGGRAGWKSDVPSFEYDISKMKRTGWTYRYSSTDAVRETVKSLDI